MGWVEIVSTPSLTSPVCRNSQDDHLLSALAHGRCDGHVMGDKDPLSIKRRKGIPILSQGEFRKFESRPRKKGKVDRL
jgi:hypothetical protein